MRIPVCEPLYLGREIEYATDAVRSGWIGSSGRYLSEFEAKFSAYCGVRHGVAATSGTTALHLTLRALGVGAGDEVIIPDFSMAAVLFAVLYVGAKPVFVDAEPETWNIDPSGIESKITPKTKAIIAVHTYGHPCDMEPIVSLARKMKIKVVEDAAEAHGAVYKGRRAGSLGDLACFSFYGNKIITTGEGGMVVTDDDKMAERCRYYKNLCFPVKGARDYRHDDVGYNYRMTNVQAAIGLAQLENIERFVERRRENARLYTQKLEKVCGIQCPVEKSYAKNVYWMYGVVIDPKRLRISRDALCRRLAERGVETRPFFKPLRLQKPVGRRVAGRYPVSDRLSESGLYLPSGSGLTREQIDFVCQTLVDALAAR